jgi:hypothetical protein
LLKLYPRKFYADFAQEMLEVFSMKMDELAQRGSGHVLSCLLTELAELPVALIGQHIYQRKKRIMAFLEYESAQETTVARWVARGISSLTIGLILLTYVLNEDIRNEPTLPVIVLWLIVMGMVIAWRWERIGGLITLFLSPLLFLSVIVEWLGADGLITPAWQLSLIGIAMTVTFSIVGWLFVSVARYTDVTGKVGDKNDANQPARRRRGIYIILIVLGLIAMTLFILPLGIPVQQQTEYSDADALIDEFGASVDLLRQQGAVVGVGSGSFERDPFSVSGRELNVDGATIQVFKYEDVALVTAEITSLNEASDAGWLGVSWNDEPHLYRAGRVLVLYDGADGKILATLEAAFGAPIIGE